MKSFFTYLLLVLSLQGMSQATAVTADPGVGAIFLTDLTGTTTLNANTLVINTAILLHLPIYNTHQTNAIPTNTTKINLITFCIGILF